MKKIFAVLALILLSGCVGTTPPAKFYGLRSVNANEVAAISSRKLSIGISEVEIPGYLDRPQIVTSQNGDIETNMSELNRWNENLAAMMQRTIAADIAAYLPKSLVKPRSSSREKFDYLVFVEVNKMEGTWKRSAVLDVWWYVVNAEGKTILRQRTDLQRPLADSYEDYVIQQSNLISVLSQQIALQISRK